MDALTHNENAEAAVLGSMLLDRETVPAVCSILKDESYLSRTEHRIIFDCLCSQYESGGGWDLVCFRDWLKSAGNLSAAGGIEYLVKLAETVPSAANAVHYAGLVFGAYKRRRMAEHGEGLRRAANEPGNVTEALQAAQSGLQELTGELSDTPTDGAEAVKTLIDDSIQNRRQIIRMPWTITSKLSNALQPGTISILCGGIGASKSFAKSELLNFVIEQGHPAAAFELEDSQGFHLARMLAQKTELPGLTDPDWIQKNPSIAEAAFSENESWLKKIGPAVDADGGGQVTYNRLLSWVLQRARQGCRLLIIDPITAIQHKTNQTWTEDNEFLQRVKRTAVDYGVAVLLITHSSKTTITPGLESLAGGASFSRFAQTVLWLEAHESKMSNVRFDCGTLETTHNRTLHLLKTRLGKGQGLRVAATFTDKLKLIEHGVIVKKQKGFSYE